MSIEHEGAARQPLCPVVHEVVAITLGIRLQHAIYHATTAITKVMCLCRAVTGLLLHVVQ